MPSRISFAAFLNAVFHAPETTKEIIKNHSTRPLKPVNFQNTLQCNAKVAAS
jgi:hypothetical protein